MIAVTTRRVTAAPPSAAADATETKIAVPWGLRRVCPSLVSARKIPRRPRPAPVAVIISRDLNTIVLIAIRLS
jgi:hypothetical protein